MSQDYKKYLSRP